jgi:hypothetical protein
MLRKEFQTEVIGRASDRIDSNKRRQFQFK